MGVLDHWNPWIFDAEPGLEDGPDGAAEHERTYKEAEARRLLKELEHTDV
jgi:hypothetical protein